MEHNTNARSSDGFVAPLREKGGSGEFKSKRDNKARRPAFSNGFLKRRNLSSFERSASSVLANSQNWPLVLADSSKSNKLNAAAAGR